MLLWVISTPRLTELKSGFFTGSLILNNSPIYDHAWSGLFTVSIINDLMMYPHINALLVSSNHIMIL
jgi:hypothetical protein